MGKYFFFIILITNTFLHFNCSKARENKLPEGQFSLAKGECTSNNSNINICFQKLVTDSRCPDGAVCITQGYAMAEFLYTDGQQSLIFNLSSINWPPFHKDTTINNTKISLINITPYPSIYSRISSPPKVIFEVK